MVNFYSYEIEEHQGDYTIKPINPTQRGAKMTYVIEQNPTARVAATTTTTKKRNINIQIRTTT